MYIGTSRSRISHRDKCPSQRKIEDCDAIAAATNPLLNRSNHTQCSKIHTSKAATSRTPRDLRSCLPFRGTRRPSLPLIPLTDSRAQRYIDRYFRLTEVLKGELGIAPRYNATDPVAWLEWAHGACWMLVRCNSFLDVTTGPHCT